jgi:hypothetical protein
MNLSAFASVAPFLTNVLVVVGLVLFLFFGIHRSLIRSGIIPPLEQSAAPPIVLALLRYGFWIALAMIGAGLAFYAIDKGLISKSGTVEIRGSVVQSPKDGDAIIGGVVNKR